MPRGSKPGERRGGRQRGTPNKKTVLRNAAINAAAANPDLLPLDFILRLMRDPESPSELRITMAEVAAPFVHRRPTTNGHPGKRDTLKYGSLLRAVNKGKLSRSGGAPSAKEANPDQSPLEFLLEVMRDPNAAPETRIRVARALAPFVHPKLGRDREAEKAEAELLEELGDFIIEPAVAAAIQEDKLRLEELYRKRQDANRPLISKDFQRDADGQLAVQDLQRYADCINRPLTSEDLQEEAELRARIIEMARAIECHQGPRTRHGWVDNSTLRRLSDKRNSPPPHNVLTEMEEAMEAQLMARDAAYNESPPVRGQRRISELSRKLSRSGLNTDEQNELDSLQALYPELLDDPTHPFNEARKAWRKARAELDAGRRR